MQSKLCLAAVLGALILGGCGSDSSNSEDSSNLVTSLFPTEVDSAESGEGDNTKSAAEVIELETIHKRTIFPQGDVDWVSLELQADTYYEMSANQMCHDCDIKMSLYRDESNPPVSFEDYFERDSRILIRMPESGTYYIKIESQDPNSISNYTFSAHEYIDADEDAYSDYYDCNDNNVNVHPGADEIHGDGIDQDCNGTDLIENNVADSFENNDDYKTATIIPYMAGRYAESTFIFQQHGNDVHTIHDESDVDWLKLIVPPYSAATLDFRYHNFQPAIEPFQADGVTPYVPTEEAAINRTNENLVIYLKVSQNGTGYYMPHARFFGYDHDQDGFYTMQSTSSYDCNDNDATINPDAGEIADDGIDQDCNGADEITENL